MIELSCQVNGTDAGHSEVADPSTPLFAVRRSGSSSPRPPHGYGWQRERTKALQRICNLIAREVRAGKSTVSEEIRRAARRWNGKPFKCDSARTFRLSKGTIRRAYYDWLKRGEAAFQLDYKTMAGVRLPRPIVADFVRICLRPQTRSVAEAVRLVDRRWQAAHPRREFPWSVGLFYRALGPGLRKQVAATFRQRAKMARAEAELRANLLKLG